MTVKTPQIRCVSVGSTRTVHVDFTDDLDSGVLLTGTPTAVEQTTSDLTLGTVIVTTATYVDKDTGETVAVGKAVQFQVSGGSAGVEYEILVTASDDKATADTYTEMIRLRYQ